MCLHNHAYEHRGMCSVCVCVYMGMHMHIIVHVCIYIVYGCVHMCVPGSARMS